MYVVGWYCGMHVCIVLCFHCTLRYLTHKQAKYLYYIGITIVPSYTGKYHEFVAVVLLRVRSTSNNAEGDKRVICFRYSLVLW